MSKLDDILDDAIISLAGDYNRGLLPDEIGYDEVKEAMANLKDVLKDDTKEKLKELMLELVGDDHGAENIGPVSRISETMATKMIIEDGFRHELRRKVNEL